MGGDGVVLLHGIFRTRRSMSPLEKALRRSGYATLNLDYPSRKYPIEMLSARMNGDVSAFAAGLDGQLHFIGYSMGGLLIRSYIRQFRPLNLGKVVMLGTPNQGSEVADFYKGWKLYNWLYGPAGQQLVTQYARAGELYAAVDFPLGVIAGNRNIDPMSARLIPGENDGKVSVESTRLTGMSDHIVLPVSHTFLPLRKIVHEQALHFLKEGRFSSRT